MPPVFPVRKSLYNRWLLVSIFHDKSIFYICLYSGDAGWCALGKQAWGLGVVAVQIACLQTGTVSFIMKHAFQILTYLLWNWVMGRRLSLISLWQQLLVLPSIFFVFEKKNSLLGYRLLLRHWEDECWKHFPFRSQDFLRRPRWSRQIIFFLLARWIVLNKQRAERIKVPQSEWAFPATSIDMNQSS